jgi:hypothetical protein
MRDQATWDQDGRRPGQGCPRPAREERPMRTRTCSHSRFSPPTSGQAEPTASNTLANGTALSSGRGAQSCGLSQGDGRPGKKWCLAPRERNSRCGRGPAVTQPLARTVGQARPTNPRPAPMGPAWGQGVGARSYGPSQGGGRPGRACRRTRVGGTIGTNTNLRSLKHGRQPSRAHEPQTRTDSRPGLGRGCVIARTGGRAADAPSEDATGPARMERLARAQPCCHAAFSAR